MKLLLLGTTGYHPNERRHTACFMLPELGVVLDAGTGMFRVRDALQTPTLDIFLTHAHLDHVLGLTFLFDVLYDKPVTQTRVHGEAEKLAAIDRHLFAPPIFPVKPPFTFCPLPPTALATPGTDFTTEANGVRLRDGSRLTYFPLAHPGGAVGYRIDWPDRSLAYVTDTTATPDAPYLPYIRNVDLLLHECYFPDGWESQAKLTGHSCLTPVARVAAASEAKRVILVHSTPLSESDPPLDVGLVKNICPRLELGTDLQEVEF